MTREQIQQAIAALPADERSRLLAWLERLQTDSGSPAAAADSPAETLGRLAGRTFAALRQRLRDQ
jgi:hypothetical protein